MARICQETRQIYLKLVFAGSPGAGKGSNVCFAHSLLDEAFRTPIITAPTSTDQTMSFRYRPPEPQLIAGYQTCFQVFTVPGQAHYMATWELTLRSTDGVVLVIDSSPDAQPANLEALHTFEHVASLAGHQPESLPRILQYNKRDLSAAISLEELDRRYNPRKRAAFEAIAVEGIGVMECLNELTRQIIERFKRETLPKFSHQNLPSKAKSLW